MAKVTLTPPTTMTQNNVANHLAAAALLAEKTREVNELKLRCIEQENQLMAMTRTLERAREDNRQLRFKLSQAVSKFDEYRVQNEEYQRFVAKSKERINSLMEENEEYQKFAADSKQRINLFLDSLEEEDN